MISPIRNALNMAALLGLVILVTPLFGDDISESKSGVRGALVRPAVYTRIVGEATAAPTFAMQTDTPAKSANIELAHYGVRHYGGGFYGGGGYRGGFYGGYRPYYGYGFSYRPYYAGYYGYRNFYRPYYAGYYGYGYRPWYAGYGGFGGYYGGYGYGYGCGSYPYVASSYYYPTGYYAARPTWYSSPWYYGYSNYGYDNGCGCGGYSYQPCCSCSVNTSYSPYCYGAATTWSPYAAYTVKPGLAPSAAPVYARVIVLSTPTAKSSGTVISTPPIAENRVRVIKPVSATALTYF